jgi:hypothetical protein
MRRPTNVRGEIALNGAMHRQKSSTKPMTPKETLPKKRGKDSPTLVRTIKVVQVYMHSVICRADFGK